MNKTAFKLVWIFSLAVSACARPTDDVETTFDAGIDAESQNEDVGLDARSEADSQSEAWNLTTVTTIDIWLRGAGSPLAGVTAVVRTSGREIESPRELLWTGVSDESGHAAGSLIMPPGTTEVEMTMQRAGWMGPYTTPTLRTTFGAFAPSAWLRLTPSQLGSVHLTFSPESGEAQ